MATKAITKTPANLPAERIEQLHQRATNLADASKAPTTHRAYAKGWTTFESFCTSGGLNDPMQANADLIRLWLASMFDQGLAVATIKQRLSAVNQRFKAQGLDSPAAMANVVRYLDAKGNETVETLGQVFKGLRRLDTGREVVAGHRGQAKALLAEDVTAILRMIQDDTMAAARDRLMIALGFGGFLRRSELVALNVNDIAPQPDGSVIVTVRSSKTDQEGKGATVEIRCGKTVCPDELLSDWLNVTGICEGALFRPVTKADTLRPGRLTGRSVASILKRRAAAAGIDSGRVSGHSLRRGAATSARAAGADALAICRAGRWEDGSTVVNRYIEEVDGNGLDLGW